MLYGWLYWSCQIPVAFLTLFPTVKCKHTVSSWRQTRLRKQHSWPKWMWMWAADQVVTLSVWPVVTAYIWNRNNVIEHLKDDIEVCLGFVGYGRDRERVCGVCVCLRPCLSDWRLCVSTSVHEMLKTDVTVTPSLSLLCREIFDLAQWSTFTLIYLRVHMADLITFFCMAFIIHELGQSLNCSAAPTHVPTADGILLE